VGPVGGETGSAIACRNDRGGEPLAWIAQQNNRDVLPVCGLFRGVMLVTIESEGAASRSERAANAAKASPRVTLVDYASVKTTSAALEVFYRDRCGM
jgi:hypothetical protein